MVWLFCPVVDDPGVLPPWTGRLPAADEDMVGVKRNMGEALGLIVMWVKVTGSAVLTGISPVRVAALDLQRGKEARHEKRRHRHVAGAGRWQAISHHVCALDRHGDRIIDRLLD